MLAHGYIGWQVSVGRCSIESIGYARLGWDYKQSHALFNLFCTDT